MIDWPPLVIAQLTLHEALRRRLLVAVAVLTLVLVGLTAWGFATLVSLPCRGGAPCSPIEVKALAATLLILVMFMFSRAFALGAVFVAVPTVATDVESGVALAMLSRPIRRSDLLLGKWLGLATLVGGYALATSWAEFAAVGFLVGYSPPHPILAGLFLVAESLVMLTLALLCSTRLPPMTGGVVALLLFGLTWMGGIALQVGAALETAASSDKATIIRMVGEATSIILPADGLWRGALYNLQPSLLAEASTARMFALNPFFAQSPPPLPYLVWVAVWMVAVFGVAAWSFSRREI